MPLQKILKGLGLMTFALGLSFNAPADKKVYIQVGEARIKRSLLALTPFQFTGSPSLNKDYLKIGKELYGTVQNDLDVSSYFQFVPPSTYLENVGLSSIKPKPVDKNGFNFDDWKPLGADFLIKGAYHLDRQTLSLEIYLYHVPSAKLVFGKQYQSATKSVRQLAHKFSNDVLEKLTGRRGMFESRVVVSVMKSADNKKKKKARQQRHKEIYIMDWDTHSARPITNHRSISISPAWSVDQKTIAYTAFKNHVRSKKWNADLFLYDLISGVHRIISARQGINSGAAFIPKSRDLLMTISKGGKPDIYRVNRAGRILEQLTCGPAGAMNVEPAISPDGQKLAFSSDRSSRPMIYVAPLNVGPIPKNKKTCRRRKFKRIVFAGWYNANPSWSPDSQKIAFAGYDKELKHFDIFLMNHDGTNLIRLTTARKINGKFSNNESPTFSPDGRHVMFISDRMGHKQLFIVNVDGSNERRISFDHHNYYKPKWSNNPR